MNTKNNIGSQSATNASSKPISEIISEAECLRRVPVSRRTWFSWRAEGKVPTIKINRRCLYHWPSVEAALLRMQRGGVMIIVFLFAALTASAMGHTTILEVSLQAQAAPIAVCKLPLGNTKSGQITHQRVNIAGPGSVNVRARGVAGLVLSNDPGRASSSTPADQFNNKQ